MRQRALILLGFLAWVALSLSTVSSLVAWKFSWASELGRPLVWHLYDPRAALVWWRVWGHLPAYRHLYISAASWSLLVIIAPFFAFHLWRLYGPMKVGRDRNEGLGTAADLLASGDLSTSKRGVVVGRDGRKIVWATTDGHVLITGPTRAGKGTGHIVPTCLTYPGAMLLNDPKCELAAITRRHRSTLGPTFVFNPLDPASDQFNPLGEIRGGHGHEDQRHLVGDCQAAAHLMAHDGMPTKDPFWNNASGQLMAAVLVHVCTSEDRTLAHVWNVVDGISRNVYPGATHDFAIRGFLRHAELEDRLRTSINESLLVHLDFLADPMVQQSTARSAFRASDLQATDRPATVYLTLPPDRAEQLKPLTRLLIHSLLNPLLGDLKLTADGRRKQRNVLVLIDEFPTLGKIDVLETGIARSAGYGVQFALVCQDADQIEAIYGNHQSITSNCSTIVVIPGFSGRALQTVARWAGEMAVRHSSRQRSGGWKGTSHTESEARVAVLNARDMLLRGRKEGLVFQRGCLPTWLQRANFYAMRSLRGLYDDLPELAHTETRHPAPDSGNEELRKIWATTP